MEVLELPFQAHESKTALMHVSASGELEMVKLLFESGADMNIKGDKVFQFRCGGSSTNTLLRWVWLGTALRIELWPFGSSQSPHRVRS
jgi:ankyrin repeat protein